MIEAIPVRSAQQVDLRQVELMPVPPYDFAWTLAWLRTSSSAVLEAVQDDDVCRRALTLPGRDVLIELRSIGTPDAPRLLLDVHGEDVDDALTAEAERWVRRVFLLDADPATFLAVAGSEPVFAALARRFAGFRPLLLASPFEALIWAILGQQVNVSFARSLKRTLCALAGRELVLDGRTHPLMPEPVAIAALDPDLLRASHFSRQKAAYVLDVSRAVATGELDFTAIAALPHDEAIAALTRHKGIGRWTAEYVLMRGLGFPDSIPAADLGLRAVMGRAYGLERTATETEVRDIATAWAGWRSWAALYWWLALQLETLGRRGG